MSQDAKRYHEIRSSIRTGDLIEWGANSILGKAIRAVTGQNVNHSSVAVWLRMEQGALYDIRNAESHRLYVLEAIENGFRLTFLSAKIDSFDGVVYWSALRDRMQPRARRMMYVLQKLEGVGYDWTSLIRNLWRRVPLDSKRMYCSEALHWAMIQAGMIGPDYSPTGLSRHQGCGIRPGEFGRTGVFDEPVKIENCLWRMLKRKGIPST